jgi:hypothetical protein
MTDEDSRSMQPVDADENSYSRISQSMNLQFKCKQTESFENKPGDI